MSKRARSRLLSFVCLLAVGLGGCASKVLKVENSEEILSNSEYDKVIEVQALPGEGDQAQNDTGAYVNKDAPAYVPAPSTQSQVPQQSAAKDKKGKKGKEPKTVAGAIPATSDKNAKSAPSAGKITKAATPTDAKAAAPTEVKPTSGGKHEPSIEDGSGFTLRRPVNDPFRVGERVTLELSYFGVVAGDMTLEVRPFKVVNGRKSYHFAGVAKSTSVFAVFYAVDDWVETFLDYDDMIPFNYALHVKESKQLREVRSYFDWKAMRGFVWDRKITKEKGVDEKKYEWGILPYSQNVFSAPFYLRAFKLEPGKKIQFRVGHEGKNIIVTGDVLRREKLTTALGELDTLVVKPTLEIDGVFKPVGDILFWLTDDDRKFIVRIESKIKIGKIVGTVKAIEKGAP